MCTQPFCSLIQIHGHNRARQRDKLGHILEEFATLQDEVSCSSFFLICVDASLVVVEFLRDHHRWIGVLSFSSWQQLSWWWHIQRQQVTQVNSLSRQHGQQLTANSSTSWTLLLSGMSRITPSVVNKTCNPSSFFCYLSVFASVCSYSLKAM